jgi:hypothetical protein
MSARNKIVSWLEKRETTGQRVSLPPRTCTLTVFKHDENGQISHDKKYILRECQITMLLDLFEQMAAVLPLKEWKTLRLFLHGNFDSRGILLYQQEYFVNPGHLNFEWVKKIIRQSKEPAHFHLHKRFTN